MLQNALLYHTVHNPHCEIYYEARDKQSSFIVFGYKRWHIAPDDLLTSMLPSSLSCTQWLQPSRYHASGFLAQEHQQQVPMLHRKGWAITMHHSAPHLFAC